MVIAMTHKTGDHLRQYVCELQWIRNGIPGFPEIVAPLLQIMERIYIQTVKRTKLNRCTVKTYRFMLWSV